MLNVGRWEVIYPWSHFTLLSADEFLLWASACYFVHLSLFVCMDTDWKYLTRENQYENHYLGISGTLRSAAYLDGQIKQDHCASFSKLCTYGQFWEGTDCHSYVWPVLEQLWLSLGTVVVLLTSLKSSFKKMPPFFRIAWCSVRSNSCILNYATSPVLSVSLVKAPWTVRMGRMKEQGHWEDKPRPVSAPASSLCGPQAVWLMRCGDLNLKLSFSYWRPTHRQGIREEMRVRWQSCR